MVCKAIAWSFIEEEEQRGHQQILLLCVPWIRVVVTVEGELERYHLPFPGAGNQLILERSMSMKILYQVYHTLGVRVLECGFISLSKVNTCTCSQVPTELFVVCTIM